MKTNSLRLLLCLLYRSDLHIMMLHLSSPGSAYKLLFLHHKKTLKTRREDSFQPLPRLPQHLVTELLLLVQTCWTIQTTHKTNGNLNSPGWFASGETLSSHQTRWWHTPLTNGNGTFPHWSFPWQSPRLDSPKCKAARTTFNIQLQICSVSKTCSCG